MEYLTASEMKCLTEESVKDSDITLLTQCFINKLYKAMVDSANNHNYKLNIDIIHKSRDIYFDQMDCDAVATNLTDYFVAKGFTVSKLFVEMSSEDTIYGRRYVYRLLGTIEWRYV